MMRPVWLRTFAYTSIAAGACGAGILLVPRLWPELQALGWILAVAPTVTVLLIGFDRVRKCFSGMEFYKELLGRVALLGTAIVVGWVAVLEYLWLDPFILIAIPIAGMVSMILMGAVCIVYAIVRGNRMELEPPYLACPKCGYRIDNVLGPNCPECGRRFIPEPDDWKPESIGKKS